MLHLHRATWRTPFRGLALAVLLAAMLAYVAPSYAAASPAVFVSGTVTDDNATPISGVKVKAFALSADAGTGRHWTEIAPINSTSNTTDVNGKWAVQLPPGTYKFEYVGAAYADQYDPDAGFIDQGTSSAVTTANQTKDLGIAKLHRPATFKGKLTDSGGNPLAAGTVTVEYRFPDGTWGNGPTATTATNGSWSVVAPPTTPLNSAYRIRIDATGFRTAWRSTVGTDGTTTDSAQASSTTGSAGTTTDLGTAVLRATTSQAGTLNGTVRTAAGQIPASGSVQLYSRRVTTTASGARHETWSTAAVVASYANGTYTADVPQGDYRLAFFPGNDAPTFYPAARGLDGATTLTVGPGTTKTANLILPAPGTVSGHVTFASTPVDASLTAIAPYVSSIDNGVPSVTYLRVTPASNLTTGSDSAFSFSLSAGSWLIEASDSAGHTALYPNAPSSVTAQAVPVTAGGTMSNVDIEIAPQPAALTAVTNTVRPTISGNTAQGSTLTADPGAWLPGGATSPAYQWKADGVAITGATSSTFTPGSDQAGKQISVTVTVGKTGLASGTATSASTSKIPAGLLDGLTGGGTTSGGTDPITGVVCGLLPICPTETSDSPLDDLLGGLTGSGGDSSPTNSALPTITGTPAVGSLLTVNPGTWSSTGTAQYQWLSDGVPLAWANGPRHVVSLAEGGNKLSVKVWFTDGTTGLTGSALTAVTAAVPVPVIANLTAPTVTGTARVGETLVAGIGTWDPQPTTWRFQWKVGGTAVSGATSSTYVVRPADLGKTVTVDVTPSRLGYTGSAVTSSASAAVAPAVVVPPKTTPAAHPKAVIGVATKALKHRKLRVTVTLSASGVRAFTGWLTVRVGGRSKVALAHNGRIVVTLTKLRKGKRTLKVTFDRSTAVTSTSVTKKVKIKA
ncbi:hypothetical protein [Nocardioides sp. Kera G14]|uniref:hypothetical protein n=1 Tax=Nocardioides sp. Kera G14 TaxID=2884264 RepID=UPI001D12C9D8|nr:hypothetical protein [Nocardioides sp. Kera G14]UDY22582.1 hypothetical protein LH076_10905 [Nocardioides sp. Kera G14]